MSKSIMKSADSFSSLIMSNKGKAMGSAIAALYAWHKQHGEADPNKKQMFTILATVGVIMAGYFAMKKGKK